MEKGIFNNFYKYLVEYFNERQPQNSTAESELLFAKRNAAFKIFEKEGFPSTKREEWKNTNLNRLLKDDFKIQVLDPSFQKISVDIEGLDTCRIVLINGQLEPELSHGIPEGVTFLNTKELLNDPAFVAKIGTIADDETDALLALNTAFFTNCYLVHVAENAVIEKPLHVTHIYTQHPEAAFVSYRMLVVAEKVSEATVIETFHSYTDNPVFVSYVSEQQIAESAVYHTHVINALGENVNFVHHREVIQATRSVLNNSNIILGSAAFTRNDLNFRLQGSGTETNLLGTYIVNGNQHVDNHTIVDHQMPHCNSSELYRGILFDKGHAVFNGKIFVRPDAQKTNAFQQNNNMLLSDRAVVDSRPQLEIFADDVKCSHGSTVGQMNEEALFYLKSRGISEETAHRLLIEAFTYDVHSQINIEELRQYIATLLNMKLQKENLEVA